MTEKNASQRTERRGLPRWGLASPSRALQDATNALMSRPRFSLRLQLFLAFLLVFLLAVAIAVALMFSIYNVAWKVRFLEIVSDYVFEIDNARRNEKNYFLYGTDLEDAIASVHRAEEILARHEQELSQVLDSSEWHSVLQNIDNYENSLTDLLEYEGEAGMAPGGVTMEQYERKVRDQGHRMTQFARDLMKRERHSIESTMENARRFQGFSLIFLLFSVIVVAYVIGGNIVRTIVRFESYANRIADGDFTPIVPQRRYRDEFTDLGLAINQMMLELQEHEDLLVQTHKMRAIGTLTAGVAHELNNPLNNMTLTAYMLLEEFADLSDEERKEMVIEVVQEADRAKKIVRNLLDFTRQSEIEIDSIDVVELIEDTIALAANQLKLAKIKVEFESPHDLPRILGDSQHMKQVLLNLILNAIQASEEGSKIRIVAQQADDPGSLCIKVIDFGSGIPDAVLPRIFDPFFTTKEQSKGTGLGLSVSKGIIEKHGGAISVESQEGEGTCVSVILPGDTPADGTKAATPRGA